MKQSHVPQDKFVLVVPGADETLSSDLEFVLVSHPENTQLLASILSQELFPLLYHMSLLITQDTLMSEEAAKQTLIQTCVKARSYQLGKSVRAWVSDGLLRKLSNSMAEEASLEEVLSAPVDWLFGDPDWMRFIQLPLPERSVLLLMHVYAFDQEELEQVPWLTENTDMDFPGTAKEQTPFEAVYQTGTRFTDLFTRLRSHWEFFENQYILQSQDGTQAANTGQFDDQFDLFPKIEKVTQEISFLARRDTTHKQRLTLVKQTLWAGLLILFVITVFWYANRLPQSASQDYPHSSISRPPGVIGELLPPPPTPTPLWQENVIYAGLNPETISDIAKRFNIPEADIRQLNRLTDPEILYPQTQLYLPVPDLAYAEDSPVDDLTNLVRSPLDIDSGSDEIRQRLIESPKLWNQLWMDVQWIDYTNWLPNNRAIPSRSQLWMVQPDRSLEITGVSPGRVQERNIILKGYHYFSMTYLPRTVQSAGLLHETDLVFNTYLREMTFPGRQVNFSTTGTFTPLNLAYIDGRRVLMVDFFDDHDVREYRLWVDVYTGVLLRLQQFNPASGLLWNDRFATRIAYDFDLPAEFFDPRTPLADGFAQDQQGVILLFNSTEPTPTFALPDWQLP